eukprot:TRINITY_DN8293_c0_g1_i2.p1 TRINITY_DN8293_c0_g1~~TRINITY_DN8293_c0_g1_i2.p1  ORF type:complete len:214 (+),score=50.67 TRINITY_DN8293_c0_g1_i2:251-892(+)
MSGEGTPAYSMLKSARDKILEDWPDVKLILLIRDPAKRARSLYDMITSADWLRQHNYNLKKSRKLYMTFREAMTENFNKLRSLDMIDEELGTLNMDLIKSVDPKKGSTFIERGMYASIIEMWLQKISSDQLLIVRFEDLVDSTTQSCVLRQILRFIGLQHRNLPKKFQLALPHANDHHKKQSDGQSLDELDDFYRPFNRRLNKLMGMDMGYPT